MIDWNALTIPPPNTWNGPGFSVRMPPGFSASPPHPMNGSCYVWPPGSWWPMPNSPALIWILPIMPFQLPGLQQHYFNFDNPYVANANAQSLGLMSVLQVAPLRQTVLNGANTLIREFDALSLNGQPLRMSAMLLQGPQSVIQCIVGINLYRWVEFTGPSLQFVSNLQLTGTSAAGGEVRSVIDPSNIKRVEMQVVNPDSSVAPIMSMPTSVRGNSVFNIQMVAGAVIRFGDINGTNVQLGDHNTQSGLPTEISH